MRISDSQDAGTDERIPSEEVAIHVGDEADGKPTDRSRDVALVWELCAGEVVAHPADARNGHREELQGLIRTRLVSLQQFVLTVSFR
ncbi:hypothetical protein WOLCODRAFT_29372 [Wolfiporia cocos MD-104 SS10]|uniref:Uncharacterized protein n=1 Tax=Wolfiporia cocos (strain MD-104) TaxID=742152 RepID=A0A2H3JJW3_WOLCO|nr:hypothetical protein WOLCODRAFT_29372 [Wolfiporia cocos MD-104 SS10]